MLRAQIQFTEDQHRQLRVFARHKGVSVAEAVRISVDRLLEEERPDRHELYARAAALIGSLEDRDAAIDLSDCHDDYLSEAFL